jgi:hypothetical protein
LVVGRRRLGQRVASRSTGVHSGRGIVGSNRLDVFAQSTDESLQHWGWPPGNPGTSAEFADNRIGIRPPILELGQNARRACMRLLGGRRVARSAPPREANHDLDERDPMIRKEEGLP